MTDKDLAGRVNLVAALVTLMHPDLVADFTPEEVRRCTAARLSRNERPDVPAAFRVAFQGDEHDR